MANLFDDLETIYALGLDEVMLGDEDGNFPDLTPSDREILAAVGAEGFTGDHMGNSA
jgi:hypothetical protein